MVVMCQIYHVSSEICIMSFKVQSVNFLCSVLGYTWVNQNNATLTIGHGHYIITRSEMFAFLLSCGSHESQLSIRTKCTSIVFAYA
jgi:hypothetical protein